MDNFNGLHNHKGLESRAYRDEEAEDVGTSHAGSERPARHCVVQIDGSLQPLEQFCRQCMPAMRGMHAFSNLHIERRDCAWDRGLEGGHSLSQDIGI